VLYKAAARQRKAAELRLHLSGLVAHEIALHSCRQQQVQAGQPEKVRMIGCRLVECYSFDARCRVCVPTMRCSNCSEQWEVPPAAVGLFPNAPIVGSAWFDQSLLDMYTELAFSQDRVPCVGLHLAGACTTRERRFKCLFVLGLNTRTSHCTMIPLVT
jgi:hypothetical protein